MTGAGPAAWSVACGGWLVASASSTGAHHARCEDAALAHFPSGGGLHLCLADGVSNGDAGQLAAQRLVRHCIELPAYACGDSDAVSHWVEAGDGVVAQAITGAGHRRGAACMAGAWLDARGAGCLAHVGDCRIYRWHLRGDRVEVMPLTCDQSFAGLGEHPPPGVSWDNPARMVGSGSVGRVQASACRLSPCEGLLVCSDGVHRSLGDAQLAFLVQNGLSGQRGSRQNLLEMLSRSIVRESVTRGSEDDVCVALVWRQVSESQARKEVT